MGGAAGGDALKVVPFLTHDSFSCSVLKLCEIQTETIQITRMRLHRIIFCLFSVFMHAFSIPLSQFLRLASPDNYHNDPSIAALPSVENRIYEKMYVKPTTEKYDRFIRNGLFDFRPLIRHPYEYRIQ